MTDTPAVELHAVQHGTVVLDQDARVWCMLGRNGFTRIDGIWWWGSPRTGLVVSVTTQATIDQLNDWQATHVTWRDPDPTPVTGIPIAGAHRG